jgi:hypothetical protein
MSEKIKVNITCKQVIRYEKEIEITKEDYDELERVNGGDVQFYRQDEAYGILEGLINVHTDVTDSDDEFLDFEMEIVK